MNQGFSGISSKISSVTKGATLATDYESTPTTIQGYVVPNTGAVGSHLAVRVSGTVKTLVWIS